MREQQRWRDQHGQHGAGGGDSYSMRGTHADRLAPADTERKRMTITIDAKLRVAFNRKLHRWYRRHARDLPWRRTRDSYEVLVSELMLQQTQVSRVLTKYGEFLARFPTLAAVA